MENATKGLMIAGAILIAIVLIGIGVFLVSQAQNFLGKGASQFSELEISAFNSPLEQYEGNQNGSNVKSLLTKLNQINLDATKEGVENEKCIGISIDSATVPTDPNFTLHTVYDAAASKAVVNARAKINTGKTYTVILDYDGDTKLISQVTITDYSKDV